MKLFAHQQSAIDFVIKRGGSGALFHEIGCGKTRTALEIFRTLKDTIDVRPSIIQLGGLDVMRKNYPNLKLLVFCPISLIEGAWGEDIQKFTCYKYRKCHDEPIEYRKDTDIYILNYESLLSEKRMVDLKRMLLAGEFMCVLDESSRIKNHKAKTTKALLALRDKFLYRVVMSGTPAPNDETEYWAQVSFIKRGIFHESFYPFRSYYFHLEREKSNGQKEFTSGQVYSKLAAQQMFQRGWHYAMTTSMRTALMARIAPYAHYARKADCLDLPDQVDELRVVEMGKDQALAYGSMKSDLVAEIKEQFIVAQVALAKIMKLRQITSSFAINDQGAVSALPENPKMRELEAVLEEAGSQQVIIWCQFQEEIRQIKALLEGRCVTLYGETPDREDSINAFKNGKAQYLIAHPRSAGHGLTFVNCSLQVFYSLDYSWELYEQARGRTHRAGQVNKCTYVHLLCRGTIDEEILQVLREKKDATEILYRMVARPGSSAVQINNNALEIFSRR